MNDTPDPGPWPPAGDSGGERTRRVEILISQLLRGGVIVSFCVVFSGMVLSFVHHPEYLRVPGQLDLLTSPQRAVFPHSLSEILHGIRAVKGQSIILAGLVLLIATPVLRVAISIIGFVYQKDRKFVAITTVVLVLLLASLVLGKAEG